MNATDQPPRKHIAPDTHRDRPTPKTQLPFIHVEGSNPPQLMYYGTVDTLASAPQTGPRLSYQRIKRKIPYRIDVGGKDDSNPLGACIAEIMQLFWAKEAEVDGLLARIDGLESEKVTANSELVSLRAKVAELERQKAGKK